MERARCDSIKRSTRHNHTTGNHDHEKGVYQKRMAEQVTQEHNSRKNYVDTKRK